ncbi:hypothetical protein [Yersinia aleksiciae]|uniref:hypothetical protein n=1 Tax=Yersinia aleksiciae TaxID=263819 RepID=UPI0011A51914|nr:hypothetical protein [Yersinia aleksiciae]
MYSLIYAVSAIFLTLFSNTACADEFYKTTNDVITHFYQKGDDKDASWHKNNSGDNGVSDYSLCYNKQISQQPQQYLIVMCSDMGKSTYANEQATADLYILKQTTQGFSLLASEPDIEGQFQGTVNIGSDKWAIYISTHSMNQGYEQSHDTLHVFIKDELIPVASWTSLQNNEGAVDPDNAETQDNAESIANKLVIDNTQKDADFYPLIIHSAGYRGKTKINETYRIIYTMDKGEYTIPYELNGGY